MKYVFSEKDSIFIHLYSLEYAPSAEMVDKLRNLVFSKYTWDTEIV